MKLPFFQALRVAFAANYKFRPSAMPDLIYSCTPVILFDACQRPKRNFPVSRITDLYLFYSSFGQFLYLFYTVFGDQQLEAEIHACPLFM